MDDRRRHQRITVRGVHGNMFFSSSVEIINMSLGGIAVQLTKSLMLGREYTLRLEEKGKPMELKVTAVWSVLTSSKKGHHGDVVPFYHVGLKFDEILAGKTSELIDFMESHKDRSAEERLRGLRFKIHIPENSVLLYPSGYKVKLISPFGMLIETMQAFNREDRFPMEIFLKDGKIIRFLGRIVSCLEIKDSRPRSYDIGVEFVEIFPEDRAAIEAYLRSSDVPVKNSGK